MKRKKYKNTTIKIIAIFFSMILWTYVMSEVNPRMTKPIENVKVELLNIDSIEQAGLVLMEPKDVTVDVKIAGRRNNIINITSEDIVAQVDLRGYSEGLNKVPIDIKVPSMVEIEDFQPKQVLFKFDNIVQKQLPVVIKTVNRPASGYSVGNGKANPESVYIEGPRSWVNSVTSVVADVDVSDASGDINTTVPLKAIDDDGKEVRGVEKEPNVVNVTIPVYKVKDVVVEPQVEGTPLNGYRVTDVTVNPTTVKIRGYENNIKSINSIKTMPIDVNYLTKKIEKEVLFDLPEGIEVIDYYENPVVTVNIEEIVEKTFEYSFESINLINLKPDLSLDKSNIPDKIEITVSGVKSEINELSSQDLSLSIDLNNLEEGNHNLGFDIDIPDNIQLVNISPEIVRINLVKEQAEEDEDVE